MNLITPGLQYLRGPVSQNSSLDDEAETERSGVSHLYRESCKLQSLHEMVIYTAVEAETKFINMYSYKLIKTRVVT